MKRLLLALGTSLLLSGSISAQIEVLDFEDRPFDVNSSGLTNYHGISFDNNFFTYGWEQSPYTAYSGTVRTAINNLFTGLGEARFTFDTPDQLFLGAYFAGMNTTPVNFNLYNDGNLVATSSSLLLGSLPTWLASGYSGVVDEVGIYGDRGHLVFDDLTYSANRPDGGAVPEPSTYGLMGAAVLALGVAVRRRTTRK